VPTVQRVARPSILEASVTSRHVRTYYHPTLAKVLLVGGAVLLIALGLIALAVWILSREVSW